MSDDDRCERHDVDIESIPHDHCPYCRMEEDRHREEMERMARNAPRNVDDPASIDAYRR